MKKFLMSFMCVALLFTLTGCFGATTDDNTTTTTSDETTEDGNLSVTFDDQVVGGLTFENFAIVQDSDGISIVYFDITNNTENSIEVANIRFTLYTSGIEVVSMLESINQTLEPGESTSIIENYDVDLSGVEAVEYAVE